MAAGIITLVAQLVPTVTNLILSFRHSNGTQTLAVLIGDAEAANELNAQNLLAFQAQLGTAIPAATAAASPAPASAAVPVSVVPAPAAPAKTG